MRSLIIGALFALVALVAIAPSVRADDVPEAPAANETCAISETAGPSRAVRHAAIAGLATLLVGGSIVLRHRQRKPR